MSENVKRRFGAGAREFFKGVKGEFKKIVWPSVKTITNNTGVVIAVSLIIGVIVFILDWLFGTGLQLFLNL